MTVISDADLDAVKGQMKWFDAGAPPDDGGYSEVATKGDPRSDNDALRVWRRAAKDGINEYLVHGSAPFRLFTFFKVLEDLDFHKEWDSHCADLHRVETKEDEEFIYWEVKYPFFFSNRDYVYARRYRQDTDGSYSFVTRAVENETVPEKSGRVRVFDYHGSYMFRKRSDVAEATEVTEYVYLFYDDPRGNIPRFLLNWLVSKGIPGFMSTLYSACDKYETERRA